MPTGIFTQESEQMADIKYDEKEDILYIYIKENKPCVAYDCGAWVRIDIDNGDLISVEIPGFKRVVEGGNK